MTVLEQKDIYCVICGAKIPITECQTPKFVKKSQKRGKQ